MSRYNDDGYDSPRHPRSDNRDRSPDFYSGGGPHDYDAGYGHGSHAPDQRRDEPFQREEMTLMPPPSNHRARSVPPSEAALVQRDRSPSLAYSQSRGSHHSRSSSRSSRRSGRNRDSSPMSRARNAVEDNFTKSSAGLGASLLGAVVGGFVANRASEAALKHRDKGRNGGRQRRHSDDNAVPRAVSTLLGAVAGGLGANAIAHRVEENKDRNKHKQSWDHRSQGSGSRGPRSRDFDSDEDDDYEFVRDDRRRDDSRYQRQGHHGDRDDYYR